MQLLSKMDLKALAGKTCLLRINLDVIDLKKDSLRVDAAIPTIKLLLDNKVKIILIGHRGRPKDKEPELSVKPVVDVIFEKIGQRLEWLENTRFDPRERANDESFAKELAGKADFYVDDDFATAHHPAASNVAITKFLPSYAGLLIEKEVENLNKVFQNPQRPLVVILGGIKFDDKEVVINGLADKADYFLMGSAYIDLDQPTLKHPKVVIPQDWITDDSGKKSDIGPKTIEQYKNLIRGARTILWNGPLGEVENLKFTRGTEEIARAVSAAESFSLIGGGNTIEFLDRIDLRDKMDFVSTGGGAMLAFLGGKKLPALEALA